uniref:Uncharacterized protein n=1 Tax=Vitis vinifera TaxID=29760 RepID=A5BWF4_VITVI|nr:hypothetical protein VITISV_025472 [Vitis vinifera]
MAVSSNGSPSPSPVTSRSNPNSRNSEINNTLRRSFSGNPFTKPSIVANPRGFNPVTPANSPSDFPRRYSIAKEGGVPPHQYEKENEKDQNAKPVRIRSPAVSKGTKNFMSPTISAASKIAASPKKKVLLERNELIRTSLSSFSDGKSPLSPLNLQEVVEDSDSKSASSDSTMVDPGKRKECPVAPSPSKASKGDEVLDFPVPLKSKNDSESLSETITMGSDCVGIDDCSKTRPSPSPSSTSILAPLDADPSLPPCDPSLPSYVPKTNYANPSPPPYDPKTNYLSPRPQFLLYKPNPRIQKLLNKKQEVGLRGCKRLEDSFIFESLSDTETPEDTQSEDSSSVELEGQNEEVEESEAALTETAQEEPNVSEPNPIDIRTSNGRALEAKGVSKSYSSFRLKPIFVLLLLLVGCLCIPITDSPFIISVIDSSVGEESSFTKLYEPAELAEFARTNFDGLTRNFRLWSANTVSYFSKMIPIVKETNELGFLRFGNFTDSQVDIVGGAYLVKENQQNLQWPMKELEVGIVQMKEQGNMVTEAYEKVEEASQVNPEFEEAKLTLQAEVIEPDNSELEQIQEEYHVASHTELEQASQGKTELEEANLPLQAEVAEPHNSEVQQTEEESSVAFHIDHEAQPHNSEGQQTEEESSVAFHIDHEAQPHNSEVQQTEEESSVAFHIDHEAQSIIAEKEQEVQVSQVSKIEPEKVPEAEKLQGENKLVSRAEVEVQQIEEESSVASHVGPEAQSIIAENEQEVQVPQVSEIKTEVPQAEKLHGENKLISHTEVESSGAVFEPESSESEAWTANSQSFKELYLSLKEKSSAVNVLGISLLILILTVAAAFIFLKQQKPPTPSPAAIPMDQLLAKKLAPIPTASVENTHQGLSSRNWPTEVDMVGESCPSEMSSFQRSTSYGKRGSKGASFTSEYSMGSPSYNQKGSKGASEAQSQERGLRKSNKRESLASSSEYSTGSPSYGSFTSYEKIHIKHGCGDEEVVTPVRRSSRIRNQAGVKGVGGVLPL